MGELQTRCLVQWHHHALHKVNQHHHHHHVYLLLFLECFCTAIIPFRVTLPWELSYANDFIVIDQIKRLNEWKNNVENRGMRVNMNKTKVENGRRL